MTHNYLVLIADIIASRQIVQRAAFDASLKKALDDLNARRQGELLSPYTVTIGDEIQAVFGRADHVFGDVFTILAAVYPRRMRFSFSAGELVTPINRERAIGMDGPAFHMARERMDELKKSGHLFDVAMAESAQDHALLRPVLELVSHEVKRWKRNRLEILALMMEGQTPHQIAERLGLSDQAVYKNIDAGALEVMVDIFAQVSQHCNRLIQAQP
jgi:hypothetical protein